MLVGRSVAYTRNQSAKHTDTGCFSISGVVIGSALSNGWRSGPEAFRAGHFIRFNRNRKPGVKSLHIQTLLPRFRSEEYFVYEGLKIKLDIPFFFRPAPPLPLQWAIKDGLSRSSRRLLELSNMHAPSFVRLRLRTSWRSQRGRLCQPMSCDSEQACSRLTDLTSSCS